MDPSLSLSILRSLAIFIYFISLTLPSRAHLSPSASLFSPSKKGNDLLLAPDSTTKCQLAPPQRLLPIPAATGIIARYNRQTIPQARTPQPRTVKYRYLQLAAPGLSPRVVASLGYSLERR
ncbi:uncharacterized protein TrAFT101_004980 [Trichoderma asperellum]|uniref:uncharacterized protein n=1 Tax=Trichoderma asperellum TaxID=101201 RepID=UPI00333140F9|nr:hypothetical protein TrAFT101_004980 [Trichoderma asperellum]